ncbi:MAG: HEPN domain-containing protein [Bacteroidetes bacterium]|nr:HEPN domain-containing protein [Bacteroidota bacterium]MBU2584546.1 HEPN domain-containing protein [Bacteroidota bacterium]
MDRKAELTNEWMKKAERDLGMAELALKSKPKYTDLICFHCQQAAEKYLKARRGGLIHLEINFEKTHHLSYLLDLLSDKVVLSNSLYETAEILDDYAVEVRYPDDWFEPSKEDAVKAYELASTVKNFVLSKVN